MNGALSARLHASLEAALWSFGSGFTVLCLLLVLLGPLRRGLVELRTAVRRREIRWWQCLGGMLGALLVAVQSYAVPLVGVAVFTVAVVAGQTTSGLLVDRLGLSPNGKVGVSPARLGAAALALVGATIASTAHAGQGSAGRILVLPAVLALCVGVTFAVQLAINGHVNVRTGYALSTTWLNFGMGLTLLLLITAGRAIFAGAASGWSLAPAPWWAWLGGVCGIGAVVAASSTVRVLGVLILAIATLTGQLGAALLLDLTTAAGREQIGVQLVLGVLVTFVAAALAGLSGRR